MNKSKADKIFLNTSGIGWETKPRMEKFCWNGMYHNKWLYRGTRNGGMLGRKIGFSLDPSDCATFKQL